MLLSSIALAELFTELNVVGLRLMIALDRQVELLQFGRSVCQQRLYKSDKNESLEVSGFWHLPKSLSKFATIQNIRYDQKFNSYEMYQDDNWCDGMAPKSAIQHIWKPIWSGSWGPHPHRLKIRRQRLWWLDLLVRVVDECPQKQVLQGRFLVISG